MELNYFLIPGDDEAFQEFTDPVYNVNYSIRSHVNYVFFINAYDGRLEQMLYSSAEMIDAYSETVNIKDVENAIDQLYGKALDFLENKLKLEHEYIKTTCEYMKNDESLSGIGVNFCFIKEDGSFHKVRVAFRNQEVCEYFSVNDYDEYQESVKEYMELMSDLDGVSVEEQDTEPTMAAWDGQGDEHVVVIMDE